MTRYELTDGKSHKFWAIERDGRTLRIGFGRIGTDGQALEKSFASPAAAEKEEAKLVAEKTKKGYRAVGRKAKQAKATVDEKALGKPLVDRPPTPKQHTPATGNHRYVDPKKTWGHSRTISHAPDGRVFAGQDDAYGVAAWSSDGTLAWQVALGKPKFFGSEVTVQFVGDDLLALAGPESDKLLVLDPNTGKTRRTLKIPKANHFKVLGDLLFVLHEQETTVLRYPSLKAVAKLEEYRNSFEAALSPDGRFFVNSSDEEAHVFDAKKWKHLFTINGDVSAVAFTGDGKVLLGSRKSVVRIVDPKTGKKLGSFDVAKERSRKPSIEAIACTPKHIAVSRVDGTTVLLDARTKKPLKLFEKHTTQDYFGPPIVFSDDGTKLWVGACPKGGKAGLSGYDVSAL